VIAAVATATAVAVVIIAAAMMVLKPTMVLAAPAAAPAAVIPLAAQHGAIVTVEVEFDAPTLAVKAFDLDDAAIAFDFNDAEAIGAEARLDLGERGGSGGRGLGRGWTDGERQASRQDSDGTDHDVSPHGGRTPRRPGAGFARAALTRRRRALSALRQRPAGRILIPMRRRLFLFAALAAGLALPAEARRGRGRGGDHDEAREAVEHGRALSLAQILPLALRAVPGEVLEVELESEHGRLAYEFAILARDGRVRRLVLDARTGAVLAIEGRRGRRRRRDDD
jgi:uncharacterized membrane protein YkoI